MHHLKDHGPKYCAICKYMQNFRMTFKATLTSWVLPKTIMGVATGCPCSLVLELCQLKVSSRM